MSETSSSDETTRIMLAKTLTTIEHLGGTLDGFLEEERLTVARIEMVRQHLNVLESKHANLKGVIEATSLSKEKMETVAYDLRCILSPIKNLPTEVLFKIFSVRIKEADAVRRTEISAWRQPDPDRSALILAQVCMRWRHIFLLNPSLWNHIELHSSMREKGATSRFHHYTKLGSRAQQSLFLPDWDPNKQEVLLNALESPSNSYKRLEVDTSDDPVGDWDVKSLNSTEVIIYRDFRTTTIQHFTPLLQSASEVTIYGAPPVWGTVTWPTLQKLAIKQFCYLEKDVANGFAFERDHFIELLDATPSLTQLELDFDIRGALLVLNSSISMTHTRITHLSIHLHHFSGGNGMFGVHLDLPALHTLEFLSVHCGSNPGSMKEPVIDGLTPKILLLPVLAPYEVALAAHVPRRLPSVERLHLIGIHSRSLLRALHPRNAQDHSEAKLVPIPNLRTLHIDDSDVDGETLLAFVSARLEFHRAAPTQVCAVESIYMYDTPGVTLSDWNGILVSLEEGRVANGVA